MKISLTSEQAFQKIKQYCAYQERSHSETKDKLFLMGLFKKDVEVLLSKLIEDNYLNEERYAKQFAGGHFRTKKWGKIKIVSALQQKRVSSYNIRKALEEIEQEAYLNCLFRLTEIKWKSLAGEKFLNKLAKTTNYLLQKGYEAELIKEAIANLKTAKED